MEARFDYSRLGQQDGTFAMSLLSMQPPPGSGRSTIAVVDDDVRVLESLENLLESYGYVVRPYESPMEFLQDKILFEIDCLISDVGMPLMDGFELQQRVGNDRPQLPVILITGCHDLQKSADSAVNNRGFFRKPFDSRALLRAVAEAIH